MAMFFTAEDLQSMSQDELLAKLNAKSQEGERIKMTEKGGVSVYGMGKFPVTLYPPSWTKLLVDMRDEIIQFLLDNEAELRKRGEVSKAQAKAAAKAAAEAAKAAEAVAKARAAQGSSTGSAKPGQ